MQLTQFIYIFVGADFTMYMSDLTCLCALIAAERNEWVTVLQDCTSGRQRHTVMNPGSPLAPDYQGYLELKGLRSKLYTVVASDKVFLYKNIDVRTLGAAVCTDLYLKYLNFVFFTLMIVRIIRNGFFVCLFLFF